MLTVIDKYLIEKRKLLNLIKSINKTDVLNPDLLYLLFLNITNSKLLESDTKKSFKDLYESDLTSNTYALIEGFDKISTIASSVDERIHLERIYYTVIYDVIKRQERRTD